ncbi:MAG: sigma 54-interacting transcriptional regulator [Desulfobacterales bacterium]|nr:sigma 54-interacting transcriptional regulator [Desulfobacterales bacterium]
MTQTPKTPPPSEEVLQLEKNLANEAVASGDRENAWLHLQNIVNRLVQRPASTERDALFVSTAIQLANVSFVLGKGFSDLIVTLEEALGRAEEIGDLRSTAIIHLHLGRLFYFAEQRDNALAFFEAGKSKAESLGDEDILTQAAEFIGLYYFLQGRFREAIAYFERAAKSFESETRGRVINPSGPLWLSYCAAFLGEFHRAIGTLDYYRRLAIEGADPGLANTLRAVLGIILLSIKKNKEAYFHLSGALQEARTTQNALANYFAKGGLAFHHFLEGRYKEAGDWIEQTISEGAASGLIHQYASPIVIETVFELNRRNLWQIPSLNFMDEFNRIMSEPNIHLRGVALRLKGAEAMANAEDIHYVESLLNSSEDYLIRSGDPIQLGKTRVEMARLKLRTGDQENARILAEKARKDFASYVDVYFPDDLRPLLSIKSDMAGQQASSNEMLDMFADVIQDLAPSSNFDKLLERTVKTTNRFFGAERGGIFWFRRHGPNKGPVLRGPCNLSRADVATEAFKANLPLIFTAFRENRPQIIRRKDQEMDPSRVKAILCVPFEVEGRPRGVLYHDNSYVEDCFDEFDESQLIRMARWLTGYIDQIFEFSRQLEQKTVAHLSQLEPSDAYSIITQSPEMRELLAQTDKIAASDSAVLILGETGAGKELLARRIHQQSRRRDNPLIIVDPTVLPENLVESELFGHEKGAFTGADRQKKGRMELAHQGTLFIDEIGEVPKSIQVKLLRTLQEKTMMRVGGTKNIYSDFRLVVATNRDLASEVAAGRFREDLYYRLNVIPLTLPPLRERKEDIPLLARHFLHRFAAKYSRQGLELTRAEEAMLAGYEWPGNIRELQNVMERAVLLSKDGSLNLNLPAERRTGSRELFADLPTLDDMQRRYIRHVLSHTRGKISGPDGAAEILGMKRTTLHNRIKKLGLK